MPPVKPSRQWRSLEQLAAEPGFMERAAEEFPLLREALAKPTDRRQILRLLGAAVAAGSLTGCYSGEPSGHLIPAVHPAADIIPGLPNHYATAHVLGGYALGTVITQQNGRPIKVDGNPNHPSSLGGTGPFAQAEVLGFYDPDRGATAAHVGNPATRQQVLAALVTVQAKAAANGGEGLRILTGAISSPTFIRLMEDVLKRYPKAQWHTWEPASGDALADGAALAYGKPVEVVAHLDKADVILGFDSDLIGYAPGWARYARDFASRRNPTRTPKMSRVYAAEPSPTLLGSVADHRFIAGPAEMRAAVTALADIVLDQGSGAGGPAWVKPVADDLKANQGAAFIHAGPDVPRDLQALVLAMNEALGGRSKTYDVIAPVLAQAHKLAPLAEDMHAGRVSALLIFDCNPVFTAPAPLRFVDALARVPASFAFQKWTDETSVAAVWSAPLAHEWETWSDARGHDGTATILQPMALPLYDGFSPYELLIRLKGEVPPKVREIVQATWRQQFGADPKAFAQHWHDALAKGVVDGTASAPLDVKPQTKAQAASASADGGLSILFRPDPHVWDGRYANNPWLQELPAPLTKLTWDNPLLISPQLAHRHKLKNGDMVNLRTDAGAMAIPVWVQPGQAPDVVLAWFGNGRRVTGAVGTDAGFDVYVVMGDNGAAEITPIKDKYELASTDHHGLLFQNEDTIVRHATLAAFQKNPTFAKGKEPKPQLYHRKPGSKTAWGMSVDMNACIGCNACVIACQAENNVPTVGKGQVLMQREMQWLRIDRYYEGTPEAPDAFFQPMFCQMCQEAPCEVVCPPGATVHDAEGLNLMVYNRCIGTRFCSNNCPYKVRRFNFFAYSADQNRPPVSWNNNVSVRSGGVMEKCTYCVQRIWSARIIAAQTGVADGTIEVKTACQTACPTQAFTFGDQNNTEAEVYRRKQSPLDYALLEDLNTRPNTTYAALVRNPNPALEKERA